MPRLYKERGQKLENVLFIIHVNFDHVWAEHYPVTLNAKDTNAKVQPTVTHYHINTYEHRHHTSRKLQHMQVLLTVSG